MSETITYLEITDPAELREPESTPRVTHSIERVDDPELNRRLYEEVGGPYQWIDRLRWSAEMWRDYAAEVETWVARVESDPAAYLELKHAKSSAAISILGVRERYRGLGLGGVLLTHGIRRGFELAPRVWLSTNTMDSEYALANYEARGMRVFKRKRLR
ncbi:GNAT family N-acetyltransferase [soil metagenome]